MLGLDLFGEVIVTLDDVELWMRKVPRYDDNNRANHVRDYVLNYAVIDKIKRAKLDKSFLILNDELNIDKENLSDKLRFLITPKFHPCPHIPNSLYKKRLLAENANIDEKPKYTKPKLKLVTANVLGLIAPEKELLQA